MNRRKIIGGGSMKGGGSPGFSSFGAHDQFIELVDVPNSYTGAAGKVVVVKATEDGLEFTAESVVDRHDVKTSASDGSPDFLSTKINPAPQSGIGVSVAIVPYEHLQITTRNDGTTIDVDGAGQNRVKPLGITDAQVAAANKDGAAGTASMRTLGTGATQACAGNDVRLSDARTPLAHNFAGAEHNADTITNLNTKLSDGDVISTKSGEIAALTEKTVPVGADLVIIEDSAASNAKKKAQLSNIMFPRYVIFADQMMSPNNADWTVNAAASASADSLNNALVVRQFDDTTEEGIGFLVDIPANATNIIFNFKSRAQTAPGAATTVLPRLYRREIVDNTAIGAWSGAYAMTAIDIPTNTRYQYDSQTIALSTLSLTAGRLVLIELTRNPADGLTGDWNLLELKINFS